MIKGICHKVTTPNEADSQRVVSIGHFPAYETLVDRSLPHSGPGPHARVLAAASDWWGLPEAGPSIARHAQHAGKGTSAKAQAKAMAWKARREGKPDGDITRGRQAAHGCRQHTSQ